MKSRLGDDAGSVKHLHVISDFRRVDWFDNKAAAAGIRALEEADIDVNLVRTVAASNSNLAVTDLSGDFATAAAGVPVLLTASIHNFGAVAAENVAHSGAVRQLPTGVAPLHHCQQLLAAPGGVAPARLKQRLGHLIGRAIRRELRPARALLQPCGPLPKIALDPLVGGLTRYAIQIAQLGDAQHLAQVICNELCSLVHR